MRMLQGTQGFTKVMLVDVGADVTAGLLAAQARFYLGLARLLEAQDVEGVERAEPRLREVMWSVVKQSSPN